MLKHWDDPLKELVSRAPQDFVKWLEPESDSQTMGNSY